MTMKRGWVVRSIVVGVFSVLCATPGMVAGQTAGKKVAKPYKAPRTVDGQPDLQGVWANNSVTPLQRPKV